MCLIHRQLALGSRFLDFVGNVYCKGIAVDAFALRIYQILVGDDLGKLSLDILLRRNAQRGNDLAHFVGGHVVVLPIFQRHSGEGQCHAHHHNHDDDVKHRVYITLLIHGR